MSNQLNPAAGAAGVARRHFRNAFAFLAISFVLLSSVVQAATPTAEAPLDLNRATAEQLEALPGIGEVKAAAILAVRDARGGFGSFQELEEVRGIGPALAAKLRPLVRVDAKGRKTAKK